MLTSNVPQDPQALLGFIKRNMDSINDFIAGNLPFPKDYDATKGSIYDAIYELLPVHNIVIGETKNEVGEGSDSAYIVDMTGIIDSPATFKAELYVVHTHSNGKIDLEPYGYNSDEEILEFINDARGCDNNGKQ